MCRRGNSRRAFSLTELLLVVAVTGILVSMSVPSFRRSLEQSHADIAGANLRAVWTAQRVYWLEFHTYTDDLSALESVDLIDPTVVSGSDRYLYTIAAAASDTFTANATRTGSTKWFGQFGVDETGVITGVVQAAGEPDVSPGFQ
ncbi:MAG: type IV pilin protein [Planctomycetota bacterium]|jgi:type IV pilus assembly protein PilE